MTKITLGQIREHHPCNDSWLKLLNHFGKDKADDTEVSFKQLIEVLGVGDAIWCLRCLPEDRVGDIVNFAADCAERVLHIFEEKYPDDNRPRKAIDAARNNKQHAAYYAHTATNAAYAADDADDPEDAVRAAYYATYAAYYAARAAYYAATADVPAYAPAYYAAYAAANADVASSRENERESQADLLLKYFGDE